MGHRNDGRKRQQQQAKIAAVPGVIRLLAAIHLACLLLLSLAVRCEAEEEGRMTCTMLPLPRTLEDHCGCSPGSTGGVRIRCAGLGSTAAFDLTPDADDYLSREQVRELAHLVREIEIADSEVDSGRLELFHFAGYANLDRLSVTGSRLREVVPVDLARLRSLDLSGNELADLPPDLDSSLKGLRELNVSGNALSRLRPMAALEHLEVLDLSSNRLDEDVDRRAFESLSGGRLKYLDISNNTWSCSPKLSWLHAWTHSLSSDSVLRRVGETRCRYDDDGSSRQQGPLLLLMECYTRYVQPQCPYADNCTCLLTHVQEGQVTTNAKRVYTVQVGCAGKGLGHFPRLPRHTRAVDLSHNSLSSDAFSSLDVVEHGYNEVDNLTLDHNNIVSLTEKLLDMRLKLRFSAMHNRLTDISYDFSRHLIQSTDVIRLSHNPWKCSCGSQIADLILLSKIKDKGELVCGPSSTIDLAHKRIDDIKPEELCPPESADDESQQELLLQLLCILFAVLIVVIMTKLAYDYWIYRTRGQLPWIVLKMP